LRLKLGILPHQNYEAVELVALDANVMLIDGTKELEKKTEPENKHAT